MKGSKREKRPGYWELRVPNGRDPVTGKQRYLSESFRGTESKANTALAGLVARVSSESHRPTSTATLAALMQKWVAACEGRSLGAGTLKNYREYTATIGRPVSTLLAKADAEALETWFERHDIDEPIAGRPTAEQRDRFVRSFFAEHPTRAAAFALGDVKLAKLTTDDLDFFYTCLGAIGRSPNTISRYHSAINGAINYGMSRTPPWITHNPAPATTRPSAVAPDIYVPTPAQVNALIAAGGHHRPEWATFLRLAAASWARRGELVALQRSAVMLDPPAGRDPEILIAKSMSVHQGLKDTKTHTKRQLTIDGGTAVSLLDHFTAMEKRAADAGVGLVADPFVFSDEPDGSRPWHPDTPTDFFDKLRREVGVLDMRLHDLRHFGATQAIAAGVPITTVSYRCGHSKVTTTLNIYAHWLPATDQLASALMGELLGAHGALPARSLPAA